MYLQLLKICPITFCFLSHSEMTDSTVTVMSEDCEQQIVVVGTAVGVLSTLLIGFLLMIIAILLFLLNQQRNKGDGDCFMLLLIRLHVVVLCNA